MLAVFAVLNWPWDSLCAVAPCSQATAALAALAAASFVWPMAAKPSRGGGDDRERFASDDGWRLMVDAMPEAALALDGAGVILHHNVPVTELFANARAGQPISYVTRNPDLLDAVDRALTSRQTVKVVLHERVPVERRVSAVISALGDGARKGAFPALLVTLRDLSEQDKLAQMRADFIANASHELRTPLASLKGFVETLQGSARDDPPAREKFLALMASQAARMTRLIDDLLSLSRVEMRAHLPPRGNLDLNDVAGYVAQTLEPLAEGLDISVEVHRLEKPARIRGDRDEIVQVLQNLVHNAIKYGRTGGVAKVRVFREERGANQTRRLGVSVSDDGPGIAPVHLPRLVERFYRVNVASSREKGGTGLGLAIVKHIVNRHRGELKIESSPGQGSTFTVLFDEIAA